jgi:hypothetical protein
MLTLDLRPCDLGFKASADGKEATDSAAQMKTLSLELENIELSARELNALLCEPHAWEVLFNSGLVPPEPYLKSIKAIELKEASEHAYVTLRVGLEQTEFAFADCKLSKLKLEPRVGGKTALSCKVTAVPVLDSSLAYLFEHLGTSIEVELRAHAPGAQQDLPLNNFGDGESSGTLKDGTTYPVKRERAKRKPKPSDGATVN